MPFEISGLSPMLKVTNLLATIKFYTETLGFTVQNQMMDDADKPMWCALKWGNAQVMFYSAESLDQPPGPPSMTGVLYFNPADVRALWAYLKDRAEVAWPLEQMPYGMLEFAIRDCNGYILSFGQEV
jgi:uncharacterized glyoxalase superfamily protein PhnB